MKTKVFEEIKNLENTGEEAEKLSHRLKDKLKEHSDEAQDIWASDKLLTFCMTDIIGLSELDTGEEMSPLEMLKIASDQNIRRAIRIGFIYGVASQLED